MHSNVRDVVVPISCDISLKRNMAFPYKTLINNNIICYLFKQVVLARYFVLVYSEVYHRVIPRLIHNLQGGFRAWKDKEPRSLFRFTLVRILEKEWSCGQLA